MQGQKDPDRLTHQATDGEEEEEKEEEEEEEKEKEEEKEANSYKATHHRARQHPPVRPPRCHSNPCPKLVQ